jgi:hypothetical protein
MRAPLHIVQDYPEVQPCFATFSQRPRELRVPPSMCARKKARDHSTPELPQTCRAIVVLLPYHSEGQVVGRHQHRAIKLYHNTQSRHRISLTPAGQALYFSTRLQSLEKLEMAVVSAYGFVNQPCSFESDALL